MKTINLKITKTLFCFLAMALIGLSSCNNTTNNTDTTNEAESTTSTNNKSLDGRWELVKLTIEGKTESVSSSAIDYEVITITAPVTIAFDYPNDPESVTETFLSTIEGNKIIMEFSTNPTNQGSYASTFTVTKSTLTLSNGNGGVSEYKKLADEATTPDTASTNENDTIQ